MLKVYTNGVDKQEFTLIDETETARFSNMDGWFSGVKLGFTVNHMYDISPSQYTSLSLVNFTEVAGVDFIAVAEKLRDTGWDKLPTEQKQMLVSAVSNFGCDGVTEDGEILEVHLSLKQTAKNIMEKALLMKSGKKELTSAQWKKLDSDINKLLTSSLLVKVVLFVQELLVLKKMTVGEMVMKGTMRSSVISK